MKFELSDKTSKFAKRTLADFSERMIVMLAVWRRTLWLVMDRSSMRIIV